MITDVGLELLVLAELVVVALLLALSLFLSLFLGLSLELGRNSGYLVKYLDSIWPFFL